MAALGRVGLYSGPFSMIHREAVVEWKQPWQDQAHAYTAEGGHATGHTSEGE